MYSKDDINKLYLEIAASIDISDEMFTAAEVNMNPLASGLTRIHLSIESAFSRRVHLDLAQLSSQSRTRTTMILIWFANSRNNMV